MNYAVITTYTPKKISSSSKMLHKSHETEIKCRLPLYTLLSLSLHFSSHSLSLARSLG
jgi:hypothetical protein